MDAKLDWRREAQGNSSKGNTCRLYRILNYCWDWRNSPSLSLKCGVIKAKVSLITTGNWHIRSLKQFCGLEHVLQFTIADLDLWPLWRKICERELNQKQNKKNRLYTTPGTNLSPSSSKAALLSLTAVSFWPGLSAWSEHRHSYVRRNGKEPLCQTDYPISNKIAAQLLDPGTSQLKCCLSSLPGRAGDTGVTATWQPPGNSTLMT